MGLQLHDKGAEVTTWQNFLISRKVDVKADGDFGPKTETATKLWQKRAGVPQTGIVDEATITAAHRFGFAANIIKKTVEVVPASQSAMFEGSKVEKINAAKLSNVAPILRTRGTAFITAANADGVIVQIVQGLRTFAEQDALFAQGRTRAGKKVTNARGGFSNHNFALALDMAPVIDGKVSWNEKHYAKFGEYADKAGLSWGGRWKSFRDLPHVELKDIPSTETLRNWYRQGGLTEVWRHFD